MPDQPRQAKMTVRLTADELELRLKLETHFGIDGNGVMRMGLLNLARKEDIKLQETPLEPASKSQTKKKR